MAWVGSGVGRLAAGLLAATALMAPAAAPAQSPGAGRAAPPAAIEAVVRVQATVPGEARSARTLGTERDGSGVVIDADGLVLTIGYLVLEADTVTLTAGNGRRIPARFTAYDHETGFGLVRALAPLGVKPAELGTSATLDVHDRVWVASHGGTDMAMPALVVSRRTFAGSWEYLLDGAIFTAPPHPVFGGAALLDQRGRLVGIGSLMVGDAAGGAQPLSGNMFVPIDRLKPILGDLMERGRASGPRAPWLGLATHEVQGRLFVGRVTEGGPAYKAGIRPGDLVLGVGGEPVDSLEGFYRKVRAVGPAGAEVPLDVLRGLKVETIRVKSADRYDFLRPGRSY